MTGAGSPSGCQSEVEELAGLLSSGDLRLLMSGMDYLCGLSGSSDGVQFLVTNELLYSAIIGLLHPERSKVTLLALKTLINCVHSTALAVNLFITTPSNVDNLFQLLESEDPQTVNDSARLLANISRSRPGAQKTLENIVQNNRLNDLVSKLTSNKPEYHYLPHIFGNLCQLSDGRELFLTKSNCIFQRILPFLSHENVICRHGMANLVKNCSFQTDCHEWLLADDDFLSAILLPLAGPGDELDDEDNESLPVDLQYLEESKKRESSIDVSLSLVHSLHKLCATRAGRAKMRACGVYIILRQFHKTLDEESDLWREVHNVVQILIGDEEPEMDNLEKVEVPEDVAEKLAQIQSEESQIQIV